MKKFKKISALLLALIMVFAMAVPAMAETENHTVSVSDVNPGSTVTFYKIVGVTYDQTSDDVREDQFWNVATIVTDDSGNTTKITIPKDTDTNLEEQIQKLAQGLQLTSGEGKVTQIGNAQTADANAEGVASITAKRGEMYIAVVTAPTPEYAKDASNYVLIDGTKTATAPTNETKANYKQVTKIYNPVLLSTAYYDDDDSAKNKTAISVHGKYKPNGVAKSSTPKVAKEITATEGTQDKELTSDEYDEDEFTKREGVSGTWQNQSGVTEGGIAAGEGAKTVSIGDTINYEVQVDLPVYPADSVNKSMWITDTFDKGITFDGVTSIKVAGFAVADGAETVKKSDASDTGFYEIKDSDGDVIAWVKQTANASSTSGGSFEVVFNYEEVKEHATTDNKIPVTYTGTLNDKCEIGHKPNLNTVEYNYSTNPNKGSTYEPKEDNKPTEDIATERDQEAVYSYEVALIKVDNDDKDLRLENAEFELYVGENTSGAKIGAIKNNTDGIYYVSTDTTASRYTTTFKTNEDGIIEVRGLEAGKYTFKETKAPDGGYTLGNDVTKTIEANWTTATYTSNESSWVTDYTKVDGYVAPKTAEENNGTAVAEVIPTQDGWIYKSQHYAGTDKTVAKTAIATATGVDPSSIDEDEILAAYKIAGQQSFEKVTNPNKTNPAGIAQDIVTNTKTPVLPSTGGIGTYIFTIVGVALLAVASFMLIFKRRKAGR